MPQFNPGTVILLAAVVLGGAWAAGLLRVRLEDGRFTLRVSSADRVVATFAFRDTGLLLVLALMMGWAVAFAVERSGWVPDTEGRLVPALAVTTVLGWIFAVAGLRRLAYLIVSVLAVLVSLLWFTPSPLTATGTSFAALLKWIQALPNQTNLLILIGLLLMFAVTGLWISWWIFRRRNGLVALLPTGTILAVEIINDVSPGPIFFTIIWLAVAASVLLRLNFVSLKEGWRTRRVPRAADTAWTFGEVGIEAIIAILAVAFLIVPPLSSADISGMLIPGVLHADALHPFGIGSGSQSGPVGSVGYSEVIRPGSQLTAKPKTVMLVTGDSPTYYPYWRGIALAGWDGIEWYPLPSTPDIPVRQQPLLAARATLPRDDLPAASQRTTVVHNTFHVVVPPEQTLSTVFSAGEIISVDNQPTTVVGIMTSVGTPAAGSAPALVNVAGDNTGIASFDTVDRIRLAKRLQVPYTYTVTEAIPNVDVQDLQAAGTDYPAWLAPYISLYQRGRIQLGFTVTRDADIAALAQQIVHAANATTPYDQARAIESWFITRGRFTYTLAPPKTPAGMRPLDYFLFDSKRGFCQDFSTAMNVMLRTLGIPSRQMSGFSQGVFDDKTRQYFVNAVDAHSWVEVFFPGYGWIPFEPTPDLTNAPINRPLTRDQLNAPAVPAPQTSARVPPNLAARQGQDGSAAAGAPFDVWRPVLVAAAGLLLLVVIALLLALRWLLAARDVPRIWRRLLFLGDRLMVPRHPGDTPDEFGGRLAASVPPLDVEVRRLAMLYTRASFRQGGLSADELAAARRAWRRIRASYPALVAKAWRDALRQGRVVREEDAASESRAPSRRR